MNVARRLLMMFAFTAALVACGVAFNLAVDPYGAWGSHLVNPIYRVVKQERVVTPYLLRTARPHTVLLGSSRIWLGMRVEQGERYGLMNAALSGARIEELCRVASVALHNPDLKRIVWGVDFFAFDRARAGLNPLFEERISGNFEPRLEDTLLSLSALHDSYEFLARAARGTARMRPTYLAEVPWPMKLVCSDFRANRSKGLVSSAPAEIVQQLYRDVPDYTGYQFSPRLLQQFRATIAAARARGVDVIMFVPPMSEYELELIRQSGNWDKFQDWKRKLAAIGPFWDFSGYNAVASYDLFFMHVMHFKTAPGQMVLRIVLQKPAPPCDPASAIVAANARRVDAENIDAHIAEQDRMRIAAQESDSGGRYARIAAQAIARRERERGGTQSGDPAGATPGRSNRRRSTGRAAPSIIDWCSRGRPEWPPAAPARAQSWPAARPEAEPDSRNSCCCCS